MRPEVRSKLPVLDLEVGDTWSYGIQSDPRKVANVRAAIRHRAAFEAAAITAAAEEEEDHERQDEHEHEREQRPQQRVARGPGAAVGGGAGAVLAAAGGEPFNWWSNFSRCLLKGFEHT